MDGGKKKAIDGEERKSLISSLPSVFSPSLSLDPTDRNFNFRSSFPSLRVMEKKGKRRKDSEERGIFSPPLFFSYPDDFQRKKAVE